MAVLTINRGLVTSPNELTKPDGAAEVLDNCVIDFDNIVQSRRGFGEFGNSTDDSSVVKQLMTYKGRILRHFSNKLSFDSTGNGTFINFSGSYSELINRLRIKYFEINSNLYFTTNLGIKKISAKTASDFTNASGFITDAGAVKALGLEGVAVSSSSGFLPAQSKVAYSVLWAKKDANGNIVRGVPSSRYVITNTSKDINRGEEFSITVTDAGAGNHKEFNSTDSVAGAVITINNHGFTAGTKVRFYGTLPKELNKNTDYFIVNVTNANVFGVSLTLGGTAIALTDAVGTGVVYSGVNNSSFFTFDTPTNKFACWFNISGDDIAPTDTSLVSRSLREVEIYKLASKTKENYIAKIAETLNNISDIQITAEASKIKVTNVDGGNVTDASNGNIPTTQIIVSKVIDGQTAFGTPANTTITFIVPTEIINNNDRAYFYEVYRTAFITTVQGQTLSDLDPGNEYQKVAEFPVAENGNPIPSSITYDDIVPENFRQGGIFLYTNPITGEGALFSNEQPPIAHDVAVFKSSAFYANTREKHRLQFNLLSVSQFVSGQSTLHIGNSQVLRSYTFLGQSEIIEFTAKRKSETVANSYFDIMSAQNKIKYRIWFDKGTLTYSFNQSNVNATSNEITITGHNLATNDKITVSGTSLPAGLSSGTYYVTRITDNILKLSSSIGGAFLDLTTASGTATITLTSEVPSSDSSILLRVPMEGFDDTVQGSVDAFKDALFDIQDFFANKISFEINLATDINATTDVISVKNHGLNNNDLVSFSKTIPSGLSEGVNYYVVEKTADSLKISLTSGGSPIDLSTGVGTCKISFVPPTGKIRITYQDNGEVSPVTQSSELALQSSWGLPVILREGFGENALNNEVLLSGLASQGLSVEDSARSLERVINKDILSPVNAFYSSGSDDLPGILILEAKSLSDDPFFLGFSNPEEVTTDAPIFVPNIPFAKTISSFTSPDLFTTSTDHDLSSGQSVYVYVKPTGESPIVIGKQVVSNTPSNTTFKLTGITGSPSTSTFDEALVFLAEVSSDNSINPNRIYFSKIGQPEAVPLVNYLDIGPKDKAIQRIMALRDSLIVLKEDGVYVITGPSAPNFSVRLSDSSALTFAPDTATNLNNLIYVLTSQGVVTVSETGVGVISRNIENKLQEVANSKFNYKLMSWGMSSESDRCYLLWLPEKTTDGYATQAFRYNTFTRTWTRWTKPANCGVVNPSDDKIYLGDSSGRPYVLKERKNFERQDFADREIVRGLGANAISGNIFTISSVTELEAGDVLVQNQYLDINKFNRTLKKLDRDALASNNYKDLKAVPGDSLSQKLIELVNKLHTDGIMVPSIPFISNNILDIRDDFNSIIEYLNSTGSGTGFKNYKKAEDLLTYETLVTGVNLRENKITVKIPNKFIQGDVTFFKGIKCLVRYAPQHFGKPEATKQVPDGTLIFDQNNFWGGTIEYASDRSYDFSSIVFSGKGPGYWDGYNWANTTFGGEGNEVPIRTLIPRDKSRCRYLHVQFTHINAREEFKLIGVSLEPREVSARGYR